jgi:hypothetical protein
MPRALGMQALPNAGIADASLTESNAMAGGRPGKRQRVSDATQQQQQAHGSGPTMHLRSAQKRLLAAQAAARADSAVGSSQQLDRTDSCGPSQGASADAAAAPATAPRKGGLHSRKKPRTVHSEQQQQTPSDLYNDALQFADVFPSRAARAGIPSPLPSYELRRNFDRPSPPLRQATGLLAAVSGVHSPAITVVAAGCVVDWQHALLPCSATMAVG